MRRLFCGGPQCAAKTPGQIVGNHPIGSFLPPKRQRETLNAIAFNAVTLQPDLTLCFAFPYPPATIAMPKCVATSSHTTAVAGTESEYLMKCLGQILLIGAALTICGCSSIPTPTDGFSSIKNTFIDPKPDKDRAEQAFASAETQFKKASELKGSDRTTAFSSAADLYRKAAKRSPGTPLEEDALMMIADSYFFANEYTKASESYDALTAKYQSTRHMDRVAQRRFAIGQYWIGMTKKPSTKDWLPDVSGRRPVMDTFGHAVKVLDKIRFDDPTGKLADDATMAAAVANFEKGKYGSADILFTDVRENFPKSEHQFEAHLLGLKSKLAMYEGPDYSGVMLDESEQLIKNMFRLFRREMQGHEEYLQNALKDIRLKKANREYSLAKFYDNRKEYGAARLYYNRVRREYSDTNLALESENRLKAIAEFPDAPEEKLEFIGKWFPEDEGRAKPLFARKAVDTKSR